MLSPLSSPAPRRGLGAGLSALVHLGAIALIIFGLPDFKRPAESAQVIPVEFLTMPPPQPQPEAQAAQPEPQPKPEPKPEPQPKPEIAEAPPPPKPTSPPPPPKPALEDIRPDKADEAEKSDKPDKAETTEEAETAPEVANLPDKPDEGAKKPDDSKAVVIGRWLLDPLTVRHTGHPCGDATENGTLDLIGERGPGQFHGTLQTHVRWTRCAPQVARFYVELRIKGDKVLMVGSGFADEGTKNGDIMRLRDAYGISTWRRQELPKAQPGAKR